LRLLVHPSLVLSAIVACWVLQDCSPSAGHCGLLAAATSCERQQLHPATPCRSVRMRSCSSRQVRPCHSHTRRRGQWRSVGRSRAVARSSLRGPLAGTCCPEAAEHRRQTGARACGAACCSGADSGASPATATPTGRRRSTCCCGVVKCELEKSREEGRVDRSPRQGHAEEYQAQVIVDAKRMKTPVNNTSPGRDVKRGRK
jgi:hypothetical protein